MTGEYTLTPQWQPYREPLSTTIARTGTIALVLGALLARRWGGMGIATLLMLWPSFGGHWVEILFLNWLRPRLPAARAVQIGARLAVWFVGGAILTIGLDVTAKALLGYRRTHYPTWWLGGIAFIGVELIAHLGLQLFRRPSFYNGRG